MRKRINLFNGKKWKCCGSFFSSLIFCWKKILSLLWDLMGGQWSPCTYCHGLCLCFFYTAVSWDCMICVEALLSCLHTGMKLSIHIEMCSLHIWVLVFSTAWCRKETEQEANFLDDERAGLSFCLWGPSWYTSLSYLSIEQNCWSGLLFSMCSRNNCTLETKSFSYTPPIGSKAIFSQDSQFRICCTSFILPLIWWLVCSFSEQ